MPTFDYKAKTSGGQVVSGVLTAENYQAALRLLDDRALFPVEVREGGVARRRLGGGQKRVSPAKVGVFYGQLADLLRAGVPMLRSLDVLARQSSSPVLKEILVEIREGVAGGETLADAMEKHPTVFRNLHVSMVRAGEAGGFLEDVLSRLGVFAERQDELRKKLVGSMIYPAILVFVGTVVVTFFLTFVIPRLRPLLSRAKLNILTEGVFWASDFLHDYGIVLLGGIALVLMVLIPYFKTTQGRRTLDVVKLKLPVLGNVVCMVAVCRFCRILGTLLQNGVPILQALGISRDSAGNVVLAGHIAEAAESVRKGETLADPLTKSGVFPIDICDMIAVAEESNTLEKVLVQIADTNEARTARMIDLVVRMLEPLLLVVMAVCILLIAVALLLPILTMSSRGLG